MVYSGYQQSKGGYAYYFNGQRSTNNQAAAKVLEVAPPVSKDHVPETNIKITKGEVTVSTKTVVMEEEVREDGLKGKGTDTGSKLKN